MNDQRTQGCTSGSPTNTSAIPDSQVRALNRRHGLDRQQKIFRKSSESARTSRNRPPG